MGSALHPATDPQEAVDVGEEVGRLAEPFAPAHDFDGTFVDEGYAAIRKLSFGSLAVPKDLGGGGHGLEAMCRAQAAIARHCASTSLAIAMHTHAVMTLAWRRALGDEEVEPVLRRVAHDGLLVSASGTLNAAMISIHLQPVEGGYLASGRRRLVSGAPGADLLVTAAKLTGPSGDLPVTVLLPLHAEGVTIVDDWDSLGMRGSGTNSVEFSNVFVPPENALYVDRGNFSPARLRHADSGGGAAQGGLRVPGLHISLLIIGSTYLGAAEAVCQEAILQMADSNRLDNPGAGRLTGAMVNEIRAAWWALEGAVRQTTDDTLGSGEQMITTLLAKRQMVQGSIRATEAAMELLGSRTYMRGNLFERTLRDVRAGVTHPLPPEGTLVQVGWETLDAAARAAT